MSDSQTDPRAQQMAEHLRAMHERWEAQQQASQRAEEEAPKPKGPWDRPATEEERLDRERLLAQWEADSQEREAAYKAHCQGIALHQLAAALQSVDQAALPVELQVKLQALVQELPLTPLADSFARVYAGARAVLQPGPAPATPPPSCPRCSDAGFVSDARRGRAIPCPDCSLARTRKRIEALWPMPPQTRALAEQPIDLPKDKPALRQLVALIDELLIGWPRGILVGIDGAYGTVKSHALAILYEHAWQTGRPAIYLASADALAEVFTRFDQRASEIDAYKPVASDDPAALQKLLDDAEQNKLDRRRASQLLVSVPWLLIDEAQSYTHKDGSGWVERHFARLVDAKLTHHTSLVLAGNSIGDGQYGRRKGASPLHPSVLDRVNSPDCVWIDLTTVASGRRNYARNAPGWREAARQQLSQKQKGADS